MARDRLGNLQLVSVAVCLWTLQIQTQSVMADYVLEIKLTAYNNPTNECEGCRERGGTKCCDSSSLTVCTGGFQGCDNQFYYCLRLLNTASHTRGCIGYNTVISTENNNDIPIDFSRPTVLGLPNPMNLTGLDTSWRGVQLYIEVLDYDRHYGDDDFVDSFSINMNESTTKGSHVTLADRLGTYGWATIGLTARFLCAENYYGELCERFDYCSAPQISCSGHGVCSSLIVGNEFTCDCEPGYTGLLCETNIDECDGVNCSGHGQCVDGVNTYSCICEPGYTGTDCQTDINVCLLNEPECSGHGRCTDSVNSFTCDCDQGFTGLLCETNIDECDGVKCSGHGQCVDGVNNFSCVCQSGYTGDLCSVDVQGRDGGSSGGIIRGMVDGLMAVIITVLLTLLVVLVVVAVRKRQVQVTRDDLKHEENVVYEEVPHTVNSQASQDEVELKLKQNPIYGRGQSASICEGHNIQSNATGISMDNNAGYGALPEGRSNRGPHTSTNQSVDDEQYSYY